ncbi:retrovirus-related pol polyprotein from transposon TNT 1-94 [Tanacetum coccineum]
MVKVYSCILGWEGNDGFRRTWTGELALNISKCFLLNDSRGLYYEKLAPNVVFWCVVNLGVLYDYWDELKETDGEKDLEAHYTNVKPLGKALPHKEKDPRSFILPCFINNICFNKALADLGANVSYMPYSTYTTPGLEDLIPTKLIVELADRTVKQPKGIAENVLVAKITLSFGNDRIFFKSNKPTRNIIKRVYALSLIKSTELDLEARLMGNALRKNRSHNPKFEDYIELSDLNKPLELRHDQVVDLGPTIEECYEHVDANFFPLLSINMMSKRFYNSIIKDKLEFKGKSIVGAFMNAPIFVGTFFVMTDFVVIEDMDHYRDEEMGDVIVGKEFCKEIRVKAKRLEGMITIYNGNDEMTYQMARSHPRFKHLTNEQCNKIPPLLKMSEEDNMNEISHSYQKLKGFYKKVLNLGLDFI